AVGVVLYELVTGRHPFVGAKSYELAGMILHQALEFPAGGKSKFSARFRHVIQRATQKLPEDRYQSAKEFQADLENASVGSLSSATAVRIRPAWSLRAALLLVALLGVIAVSWGLWRTLHARNHTVESVAILPFANGGSDPDTDYFSDGLTENLIDAVSR